MSQWTISATARAARAALAVVFVFSACEDRALPRPAQTPTAAPSATVSFVNGIYFPTMKPADAIPVAAGRGRLVLRDGCIWIESARPEGGVSAELALWPAGARMRTDAGQTLISSADGSWTAAVGQAYWYVGAGTNDLSYVTELTGTLPPEPCRTEVYWRVYRVGDTPN